MEQQEENEKTCPICQNKGTIKCGSCKSMYYCSSKHKREHWKIHKESCCPHKFIVQEDTEQGKYCVAARNLKPWTLLLEEEPAMYAPTWTDNNNNNFVPTCLTCSQSLENDQRCDLCQWPVCSIACSKMSIHADNECKIFQKTGIPFPAYSASISLQKISSCILMLRAVGLKTQNEAIYQDLLTLQHTAAVPCVDKKLQYLAMDDVQSLRELFNNDLDSPQEDYQRLNCVQRINSFCCKTKESPSTGVTAIYPKASRFNQSCVPNCRWDIMPSEQGFKIRLRTVVSVKKGEPLCLAYNMEAHLMGTIERQNIWQNEVGFTCKCARCSDVTELGTYMSAITCLSCLQDCEQGGEVDDLKFGYFLPKEPQSLQKDESEWLCNRCDAVKSFSELNLMVKLVDKLMQDVDVDGGSLAELLEMIVKLCRGFILHRNHWLLYNAVWTIIQAKGSEVMSMEREQLVEFIRHCVYLYEIQCTISPGNSPLKSFIFQNFLFNAMDEMLDRHLPSMNEMERTEFTELVSNVMADYDSHLFDIV